MPELFATVPEILVVYAWDADQRRYRMASPKLPEHHWTVHDIEPNAAYVLRIAGSLAVEWERPAVPVRGLAELRSGFNWLSWAGPSDWAVTDIARGIGRSLVSITLGNQVYRSAQPDSAANWPLIQRGDPLVVTVSRNVNWLQPAGIMSELVFLGNIPATVQQQARDDLQSVMDFYLTQFGIQPDGSSFTIRTAATMQSLIDYESAASGELDEAAISEWRHLWNESLAWSRADIVVNEELYSCTPCAGRYTMTTSCFISYRSSFEIRSEMCRVGSLKARQTGPIRSTACSTGTTNTDPSSGISEPKRPPRQAWKALSNGTRSGNTVSVTSPFSRSWRLQVRMRPFSSSDCWRPPESERPNAGHPLCNGVTRSSHRSVSRLNNSTPRLRSCRNHRREGRTSGDSPASKYSRARLAVQVTRPLIEPG